MYTGQDSFLVCVRCITYNHSDYIVDTMNGFTMQQTTFPYVCVILDDASQDGEQSLITSYIEDNFVICEGSDSYYEETDDYRMTFARHKSNCNCYFAAYLLKYNHYSIKKSKDLYVSNLKNNAKYIALCDGDDYWIDPLKIQKQVDYLDAHRETGLVYTNVNRFFQEDEIIEECFFSGKGTKNNHREFILNSWWLAPCTWVYRKELESSLPQLDNSLFFVGDTLLLLHLSSLLNVDFIEDTTAVYRVLQTSASHFRTYKDYRRFWKKNLRTRLYFAKQQPFDFRLRFLTHVVIHERPSFRAHPTCIWSWIKDSFYSFAVLFIIFKM